MFTVGKSIPDGDPNGVLDSQTITSSISAVADVDVFLTLSGQSGGGFLGDLYVALQHSGGYSVLLNRVGRSAASSAGATDGALDVLFDDSATLGDIHQYRAVLDPLRLGLPIPAVIGSWQPDGRYADPLSVLATDARLRMLSQMNGLSASGTWNLLLVDLNSGRSTRLERWGLRLSAAASPSFAVNTSVIGQGKIVLFPMLASYPSGATVQATALPTPGYGFDRWTSGTPGVNPTATLVVTAPLMLTASFKPLRSVLFQTNGLGGITVTPSGTSFLDGSTISVRAMPGANQIFAGWTGDRVATNPLVSITLTSNLTLRANFTPVYSLSLSSVGGGTVISSPLSSTWPSGSVATLSASPAAGYRFSGWSGALSGTQTPVSVSMTANKTITANFVPVYQLTAIAMPGGAVAWSPAGASFSIGATVTVTATPAAGFSFSGWTGAATGNQNPLPLVMNANKSVTANFARFSLLNLSSTAGGSVSSSPGGTNFVPGTVITLTAKTNAGYVFAGWTGDLVGLQNPIALAMNSGKTIAANFVRTYQLSVGAQSGGIVASSPAGTNFVAGSTVTLTAKPSAGYTFAGWTGSLSGTINPASIRMASNQAIMASFKPLRTVAVTAYGPGQVSPNGGSFPDGTVITLQARANPGNTMWFWFGNAYGSETNYTFTVSSNVSIGVYFVPLHSITVSNAVGGAVVAMADGVRLTNNSTRLLRAYSSISLQATPAAGYVFRTWTGTLTNLSALASFSLLGNTTVRPVFVSIATGLVSTPPITSLSSPVPLTIRLDSDRIRLDWVESGLGVLRLQESSDLLHWRDVATGSVPFYAPPPGDARSFYRINVNRAAKTPSD